MKRSNKAILAAGLLAGAAAMTGCTANTPPVVTSTPETAPQATAMPATAEPMASPTAEAGTLEETPSPIRLRVGGKATEAGALKERDMLYLPLIETAEALGWTAQSEQQQEETQTKRTVALTKEGSRITVAWTVSDNTNRQITWQRDGLLIPVDTEITTLGEIVYVPAAFFEEAMEAAVSERTDSVDVDAPQPKDTPETQEQSE